MIDFDTVAAGSRLRDLGYAAFLWLDLGNADYAAGEQRRRLAVFAAGYGRPDCRPDAIAAAAVGRQRELSRRRRREGNEALAEWASAAAAWTVRHLAAG